MLTNREPSAPTPTPWAWFSKVKLAVALRESLAGRYTAQDFRADLMAGIVVGVVALPLSMALAIASGVPPQHGLYTAIIGGCIIALLGGSRVQVSGPTAAFVAILVPIAVRFGIGGLLVSTVMAGVLLITMGAMRLGRLIEFVPYPVTTGFTAGIAVVIATLQLKDFLGLAVAEMPEHYFARVVVLAKALPTMHASDFGIGVLTLALLILWPRIDGRVPAPLIALTVATTLAFVLGHTGGFHVATINSRFSYLAGDGLVRAGIPRIAPQPVLPWHLAGPHGEPLRLSFGLIRALLPSAFAIAMLGAIESLLSAVVADAMSGGKHDPDSELLAQGLGNVVTPFFGGIAATGAIARTAANIRSGARSPIAAVVHAVFVLTTVLLAAPILGYLPMASLAALLLLVAWNMAEVPHFLKALRISPRNDVLVLVACFGLTAVFDMVVSVTAGILLAAVLFMQEMTEVSGVRLVGDSHPALDKPLPRGVLLYEVAGPLFFGAAQKAISVIERVDRRGVRVVVLDLTAVPAVDGTGLVSLQSLVARLNHAGVKVILAGVQRQPLRTFARAGWRNRKGRFRIFRDFDRGIALAQMSVAKSAVA